MLDDTLVILGRRVGRTPTVELPTPGANQGKQNGRDHKPLRLHDVAGRRRREGGYVHGCDRRFGFAAVENKVHVHDLHATILHLARLRSREADVPLRGRDFRLTDVHGRVVKELSVGRLCLPLVSAGRACPTLACRDGPLANISS